MKKNEENEIVKIAQEIIERNKKQRFSERLFNFISFLQLLVLIAILLWVIHAVN